MSSDWIELVAVQPRRARVNVTRKVHLIPTMEVVLPLGRGVLTETRRALRRPRTSRA